MICVVGNKVTSQSTDERETKERLLDAAERLFGEYSYEGVGMRMLADEAKVNLGAATYHFGSKQALSSKPFCAVSGPSTSSDCGF